MPDTSSRTGAKRRTYTTADGGGPKDDPEKRVRNNESAKPKKSGVVEAPTQESSSHAD